MSDSPRGRRRLVADRRHPTGTKPKPKTTTSKAAKPKTKATQRKPARRAKPQGNPIVRAITGLIGWIFRLAWRLTWRITLVTCLIVALAVGYVYSTLPSAQALLDGRAAAL